ncbi:protein-methionine-sulfoxide reductase catalytic subunit MsrP [Alphaproteobacteria bacterium]|nr:protein-methionine-sulfoxide reductase catalytic subunit MsrP [Alphaproteobacteria bacterium]
MNLRKKNFFTFKENLITDKTLFLDRRKFILGLSGSILGASSKELNANIQNNKFEKVIDRKLTSYTNLTKYNNFFEFGTTKKIWKEAQKLNTENWNIEIAGSNRPVKNIFLEDILKNIILEERIYKFRCVEAWSMIVPWLGFPLYKLINILEPKSDTKYVEFETFFRPKEANNQKQSWYPWPYKEVITLDEAMHPLSFIATGVYGEPLPKQNGAPIRLVLPWKYGFKSIKSIAKIKFTNSRTKSFWETIAPKEYGFWANVNPKIAHRRWSQEYEKDIETGNKYPTLIYNGYGEWVAYLYKNMTNSSIFY